MTGMTDDMTTWLRAQVEADKAAAVLAARGIWGQWRQDDPLRYPGAISSIGGPVVYDEGAPDEYAAAHIVIHDPRDVIADCDAKLRLLDLHQPVEGVGGGTECEACGPNNGSPPGLIAVIRDDDGFWPCATVQVLASGYKHRPGWREDWQEAREP